MAPAAYDTLSALFRDTHTKPEDYDLIVTGDREAFRAVMARLGFASHPAEAIS